MRSKLVRQQQYHGLSVDLECQAGVLEIDACMQIEPRTSETTLQSHDSTAVQYRDPIEVLCTHLQFRLPVHSMSQFKFIFTIKGDQHMRTDLATWSKMVRASGAIAALLRLLTSTYIEEASHLPFRFKLWRTWQFETQATWSWQHVLWNVKSRDLSRCKISSLL